MMRITLESPALIAVRSWLAGKGRTSQRSVRSGSRVRGSRTRFQAEQLEPRTMLDGASKTFMVGALPDLTDASDTGASAADNLTHDQTPTLAGSVRGPVSQVRLFIDGKRGDLLQVENGTWSYTLPAEAALTAGKHTFAVRPIDGAGKVGKLSKPLEVTIVTAAPAAPTIGLGRRSDSGVKGDGKTNVSVCNYQGTAAPGQFVNVSIDGEFAGRVRSDAKTGVWSLKSPRLANGVHDVTAVVENRAGKQSAATSFNLTINGERTVVLDSSDKNTVELMASHLLGPNSQGFIVTQVLSGTLQRWSAAKNAWVNIPRKALATDPASLQNAPAIRKIAFNEAVRWTPSKGDVGPAPVFLICPSDTAGGLTAPTPEVNTVPGEVVNAELARLQGSVGSMITWDDPADGDGCGCGSTRYSIEVTREDGQTVVYNVPRTVHGIPLVEGGTVQQVKVWGATKTGAGKARSYDATTASAALGRLKQTIANTASYTELGTVARSQLEGSLTPMRFATSLPFGSNANLAYLEVTAVPDVDEAAKGLSAGTPLIISSESNSLTSQQLADLQSKPIYARTQFPGTERGIVQGEQARVHFQPGERLKFAGTVDASVRNNATIVVEAAQILQGGELGPWLEEGRIPVGSDGSYSHEYAVAYGQHSVRARLEYRRQPTAPAAARASSVGATSSTSATVVSTSIDLSTHFNAFGITTVGWQVGNSQGFDGNGNYYNSDYNVDTLGEQDNPVPGPTIDYGGILFPIGPVPTNSNQVGGTQGPQNFVKAEGQTIAVSVDADKSGYLYLAGAASNGNQMSQKITLNFTDGTTETWTQSFHDWNSAGPPQYDSSSADSKLEPEGGLPPAAGTNRKLPVNAATTGEVRLSGLQTIDGVALAADDRVLVKNQNPASYNGIYVVAEGSWRRALDAEPDRMWGATMTVLSGTTNGGKHFYEVEPKNGFNNLMFNSIAPPVAGPLPFFGELLLKSEPERIGQTGALVNTPAHIFGYTRNLHGKQLASITLPNNNNIGILSAVVANTPGIVLDEGFDSLVLGTTHLTGVDVVALTIANESNIGAGGGPLTFFFADQPVPGSATSTQPATYTTKSLTVQMGQQTTIAYIAPDSTSQMNFYVQKADDTCVGQNCSTYLADWANGSGGSSQWASNISPSLNSQMKGGQHWTMTIENAGLGYNGYLDSPNGKGLPSANGSTPAGAQFKLMTQNEINDQPPWATAVEKIVGEIVGVVIVSALTFGAADELLATEVVMDVGEDSSVAVKTVKNTVTEVAETVAYDSEGVWTGDGYFTKVVDEFGNEAVMRRDYQWTFREITGIHPGQLVIGFIV